jgi:signal transduction histidine kinase
MEEVINHTHNLARQFSSLDVKGDDLPTVLKELAGSVKKLFQTNCSFSAKGAPPTLPAHTTLQLYKIAQEAVSNAIKHGKASQVSIGLACEDGYLILTVRNDGLPFSPPAHKTTRMGLRIMHYRANTVGATLEIKPLGKSGTLVTCSLSLKSTSKHARQADRGVVRQNRNDLEPSAAGSHPARP